MNVIKTQVLNENSSLPNQEGLTKLTVRLPKEVASEINEKPEPSVFMRQSIINQLQKEKKSKTEIMIKVDLSNTQSYSHEFSVYFSLKGQTSFREQIAEFIDAVQNLQRAITRLDP